MIAYHYSVDYTDAPSLLPDFKKKSRRVIPMLRALEKGRDWFEIFLLHEQYLAVQAEEDGGFRNYVKDAVEAVFEYIRKTEFAENSISRINCVYLCRNFDSTVHALYDDWINCGDCTKEDVKLLEVQVDDNCCQEYDQVFYDQAYELMQTHSIDEAMECARRYFSHQLSQTPMLELLSDGENQILRRLEY